jgi:hypothetical protein
VIPTARAARGGRHAGVRAFRVLRRHTGYDIRCNMTREGKGSSPRARGGRRCDGGGTTTTTGGGEVGLPRRRMRPGWPGPLGGGNSSGRFLRRCTGSQQDRGGSGGDEFGAAERLTGGSSVAILLGEGAQGPVAGLGKFLGGEAKLPQALAETEARRRGGSAVEQRRRAAERGGCGAGHR